MRRVRNDAASVVFSLAFGSVGSPSVKAENGLSLWNIRCEPIPADGSLFSADLAKPTAQSVSES